MSDLGDRSGPDDGTWKRVHPPRAPWQQRALLVAAVASLALAPACPAVHTIGSAPLDGGLPTAIDAGWDSAPPGLDAADRTETGDRRADGDRPDAPADRSLADPSDATDGVPDAQRETAPGPELSTERALLTVSALLDRALRSRDRLLLPTGSLTRARNRHAAALLADGRVLLVGGLGVGIHESTTELYDPISGTFSAGPDMSVPRRLSTAPRLWDGRVLVAGGASPTEVLASSELFVPGGAGQAGDASVPGPDLLRPRNGHHALALADGSVLLVGGHGGAEPRRPLRAFPH